MSIINPLHVSVWIIRYLHNEFASKEIPWWSCTYAQADRCIGFIIWFHFVRGVIKKTSAKYASLGFIEFKSLSVCHFILLKNIGSVNSMRSCLVAYINHFKREGCDTFAKWKNLKSERLSSFSIWKVCSHGNSWRLHGNPWEGISFLQQSEKLAA